MRGCKRERRCSRGETVVVFVGGAEEGDELASASWQGIRAGICIVGCEAGKSLRVNGYSWLRFADAVCFEMGVV